MKTIHGIIRGRTIELAENAEPPDGQEVEVQVQALAETPGKPGDGLLRTEGALADDPEWDAIMEEIHQERKRERRNLPEDV